jgi:hypothetical protein
VITFVQASDVAFITCKKATLFARQQPSSENDSGSPKAMPRNKHKANQEQKHLKMPPSAPLAVEIVSSV